MGATSGRKFFCALFFLPRERHRYPPEIDVYSIEVDGRPEDIGLCESLFIINLNRITFGWSVFTVAAVQKALAALLMGRDSIKLRLK